MSQFNYSGTSGSGLPNGPPGLSAPSHAHADGAENTAGLQAQRDNSLAALSYETAQLQEFIRETMCFYHLNLATIKKLENEVSLIISGVRAHDGATVDELNALILVLRKPLDDALVSVREAQEILATTAHILDDGPVGQIQTGNPAPLPVEATKSGEGFNELQSSEQQARNPRKP
ncbi:hypothetical protein QBC41DRAFT_333527 [Cercophora samala]|uniref:Uncharacterized protein n=1 Tax=Cercophora samala TaxID=330535 RepID=A0AA39ZLZ8_9PEZI|nr:hypothetical protein QBC41DRAFT_333527 [Cercophora samala]